MKKNYLEVYCCIIIFEHHDINLSRYLGVY